MSWKVNLKFQSSLSRSGTNQGQDESPDWHLSVPDFDGHDTENKHSSYNAGVRRKLVVALRFKLTEDNHVPPVGDLGIS